MRDIRDYKERLLAELREQIAAQILAKHGGPSCRWDYVPGKPGKVFYCTCLEDAAIARGWESPARCAGCAGMGAHRRWCEAVVGPDAARLGALAEQADDLAVRAGPVDQHASDWLWNGAGELRAKALAEAAKWRENNTHA